MLVRLGALAAAFSLVCIAGVGAAPHDVAAGAYDKKGLVRRGMCTRGAVYLGSRPGVINFFADCHAPPSGGLVELVLFRFSVRDAHRRPGILKFSRKPSITGPGARGRDGICTLRNKVLGCRARVDGRVRVSGRIWVRKGSRCAKRVVLEVAKPPLCEHGECLAVARVRVLANGRPGGC